MDYETKSATPEIKDAFDDFLRAFQDFKTAKRRAPGRARTPLRRRRHRREGRPHQQGARRAEARPRHADAGGRPPRARTERKAQNDRDMLERKSAFDRYVRRGDAAGLDALELKSSFSAGSNPDGGYTVPLEIES